MGAWGKEEAKKSQTKQEFFGKCLLTSDAEACVITELQKCWTCCFLVAPLGLLFLTICCCRSFAWSESSWESFDESAAVDCSVQRELLL